MHLKQYMEHYAVNCSEFAKRCGLSYPTILYAMQGKNMNFYTATKIVEISRGEVTYEEMAQYINKPRACKNPKKRLRRIVK